MNSSISLFGLGYVGTVSAACFAHKGHKVVGVDVSHDKVEMLESGKSPIVEARVSELIAEAHSAGLLQASTDSRTAVMQTDISFVCVGTPSLRTGKLDLSHIEQVSREIGAALREKKATATVAVATHAEGLERARQIARNYRSEFVNLHDFQLPSDLFERIPVDLMFRYNFIPLEETKDNRLAIAIADPSQLMMIDEISLLVGKRIVTRVASLAQINEVLRRTEQGRRDSKVEGDGVHSRHLPHTVVLRSTVLPGTTESVVIPIIESASGQKAGVDFNVVYNPEFMREGSAVADFLQPPYTILGSRDPRHLTQVRDLYKDLPCTTFETEIPVAEMVKYVSNLFHAVKVGFANEIGTLCKHLGVDTQVVTQIFTSDTKLNISPAYLSPGFAFGGSCLPKDLRAITYKAKELDLDLPVLQALMPSNAEHIDRAIEAVLHTGKKKVSLLGLSFKAGTDDLRESPQVQLIKRLLGEGCQIRIWDQDVSLGRLAGSNRQYIEEVIPHIGSLLSTNLEEVVKNAEVVIIGTRSSDQSHLNGFLRSDQVVIDLINLDRARRPQSAAAYQGICW